MELSREKRKNKLLLYKHHVWFSQCWAEESKHKGLHTPWLHLLKGHKEVKWISVTIRQDGSYFKRGWSNGWNGKEYEGGVWVDDDLILQLVTQSVFTLWKFIQMCNYVQCILGIFWIFYEYYEYVNLILKFSFPQSLISSTYSCLLMPQTPYWQEINH